MSSPASKLNSKIIKAGAGAGKTTALINEIYDFFLSHSLSNKQSPKIVVTTFTKKATQELRERLMLFSIEKNNDDFMEFVLSKSKLVIVTIHGLLQMLMRQYANHLNYDPGFRIISYQESFLIAKKALKKILSENEAYLIFLEEMSFYELTRILLEANAANGVEGSLRSATYNDFLECEIRILEKIKKDLFSVLEKIKAETSDRKWEDYASLVFSLKRETKLLNFVNSFSEIKKPLFYSKKETHSSDLDKALKSVSKRISDIDLAMLSEESWRLEINISKKFQELLFKFIILYKEEMTSRGFLTISDLEAEVKKIVFENKVILSGFSDSVDFWLIDEFQDTSPVQLEILGSLIGDTKKFFVGDPQQSIYFFRGARSEIFDKQFLDIQKRGGDVSLLKKNYRSQKSLMSFINYFFSNYENPFEEMEFNIEKDEFDDAASFFILENEQYKLDAIYSDILAKLKSGYSLGEIAILGKKNSALKKISQFLKNKNIPFVLHSAQGLYERREIRDCICILKFLMNPHDNENLVALLRSPWFKIEDEIIISQLKKIKKESSFWPFLIEKKDEEGFFALKELAHYLSLTTKIGVTSVLETILQEKNFISYSRLLDTSGRREANVWKFLNLLKKEDHKKDFNYSKFIEDFQSHIEIDGADSDADAVSALESDQIQIMTIHGSKGLEFDHVLIVDADDEIRKRNFQRFSIDELNKFFVLSLKMDKESANNILSKNILDNRFSEETKESDRLLYVAMTRAKKSISLFSLKDFKKNSWMSRLNIPMDVGIHKHDNFSYTVYDSPLESEFLLDSTLSNFDFAEKLKFQSSKLSESEISSQSECKIDLTRVLGMSRAGFYGKQFHRILEMYSINKNSILKSDLLDVPSQKALKYVLQLQNVPMAELLENGFPEWGYSIKDSNSLVSGRVDLWGIVDNKLWIVDYKTGNPDYKDVAFAQLKKYSDVLKKHTGLVGSNLIAIYPFHEKVFSIKG